VLQKGSRLIPITSMVVGGKKKTAATRVNGELSSVERSRSSWKRAQEESKKKRKSRQKREAKSAVSQKDKRAR